MLRFKKILHRLNLLSSIRGKITFLLLALAGTAGVAGVLTYQSFDRVSASVADMTEEDLPKLAQSNELIMAANNTKDAVLAILTSQTAEELARTADIVDSTLQDLERAVNGLPENAKPEFEAEVTQVVQTLNASIAARGDVFGNTEGLNAMTRILQTTAADLQGVLIEIADDAYFNIAVTGEDTISLIEETMLDLVENKFATLQSLLEVRSEINLLSGVTLAIATNRDTAVQSILSDLAVSSYNRLETSLDMLSETEIGLSISEDIHAIAETLSSSIEAGSSVDNDIVLSARQSADTLLASAVDDMVFELTIAADDAATGNRDAIQALLDNEIAFMNTLLEINSWLSTFQLSALKITTAQSVEQAETAAKAMQSAAQTLVGYRDFGDGKLTAQIDAMSEIANPDSGLASFRAKSIQSDQAAIEAVGETVNAVLQIAGAASMRGLESQTNLSVQAQTIATDANEVKSNLEKLGWGALAFIVVALVLNHRLIIRPLNAISLTTERLSQGDMSPVTGFDGASDEIARIAKALTVFRDGLVEKEELTRVADADRAANQERQAVAVKAIGTGLAHLARGDLSYRIKDQLTEGYAQLKVDFNKTAQTLNTTVENVVSVARSIRSGSSEISQASDDLSQRTESQAATLEETAAALEELTASVRSAAEGSRNAAGTTKEAQEEAAASGLVVENAVVAMKDIEDSSEQIAQIIGVIDDIAFQTNLLALNAGVEAARAGEAGRGFAVVASEVRGLSQRTTEAAREIKALISKSSSQVEVGVELVGRTGAALKSISERVSHISNLMGAIADSTNEQATGLGEANIAVSQLDQVTQQNAAMVEETSAAGQLLSRDAEKLSELMAHFSFSTGEGFENEVEFVEDVFEGEMLKSA